MGAGWHRHQPVSLSERCLRRTRGLVRRGQAVTSAANRGRKPARPATREEAASMYAVALLLVVAILSLLITRAATIALTVTGMARPSARFQARSALTGVGFTTTESESVVVHPTRRRIIMALMLVGNAGLVTALAGMLAGFLRARLPARSSSRSPSSSGGSACVRRLPVRPRRPVPVPADRPGPVPVHRPAGPRLRGDAAHLRRLRGQGDARPSRLMAGRPPAR